MFFFFFYWGWGDGIGPDSDKKRKVARRSAQCAAGWITCRQRAIEGDLRSSDTLVYTEPACYAAKDEITSKVDEDRIAGGVSEA